MNNRSKNIITFSQKNMETYIIEYWLYMYYCTHITNQLQSGKFFLQIW
jgi:hypothetical protein